MGKKELTCGDFPTKRVIRNAKSANWVAFFLESARPLMLPSFEWVGFSCAGAMWWHCFAKDHRWDFYILWVHVDSIVCGAPSDARRVELSMRHYILARVSMSCEMLGLHDPMSMSCMIHPVTEQSSTAQTCQRRLRLTILLRQLEPCCLWKGSFRGHHWWVGLVRSRARLPAASELFGVWA